MRVRKCFACEARLTSKPTAVYGGRMVNNQRESRLVRICHDCVIETVAPLVRAAKADLDMERCCSCGEPVDDNVGEVMYLSIYRPKSELEQFDVLLCDPHADATWEWFEQYGLVPVDRNPGSSRGPANHTGTQEEVPW